MGKAAELREAAIAKFKEADALVTGDEPKAEDQAQFDALFAEGQELMKSYQTQSAVEGKVVQVRDALSDIAGAVKGNGPIPFSVKSADISPQAGKTMGQMFVESEAYKSLVESGALRSDRQSFRTGGVDVKAATDIVTSIPTTGGASALVTPMYVPGVLPFGQQPLTVRQLFSQANTGSDTISYAQQVSVEGSANAVGQAATSNTDTAAGGLKPQASMSWERITTPVETIAVWMAATRQAIADAGQLQGLIDNQLRYLLQLEEEDQLLNGNGTSPNLSGIYDQTDLQTDTATDNLDGIRHARTLVRTGASKLNADAIILHPNDSEQIDLLKDLNDNYRGGNPVGNFTFNQPLWGLRRVESESISEGSALVGAFNAGATVYERQGIQVLTADQHADFFIRNLVVVLAEERLGFAVFFPSAFVDLTLAAWGS